MKLQSITKSLALATAFALPSMAQAEDVSLAEVRAIAKVAYIYGYLRIYWPEEAALDGSWTAPKMEMVK